MGRLLEIAESVPVVEVASAERIIGQISQLPLSAYSTQRGQEFSQQTCELSVKSELSTEPLWNPAAADVLDCVVKAGQPVTHPQIVKAMARRDYTKKEAYAAIAYCQSRGWVEHNLVSGYVLSGMSNLSGMTESIETEKEPRS